MFPYKHHYLSAHIVHTSLVECSKVRHILKVLRSGTAQVLFIARGGGGGGGEGRGGEGRGGEGRGGEGREGGREEGREGGYPTALSPGLVLTFSFGFLPQLGPWS